MIISILALALRGLDFFWTSFGSSAHITLLGYLSFDLFACFKNAKYAATKGDLLTSQKANYLDSYIPRNDRGFNYRRIIVDNCAVGLGFWEGLWRFPPESEYRFDGGLDPDIQEI